MKKRLLAVVALLVAFVMSFALIACGDKRGNGNGGQPTPTLTATKLSSAINKIKSAKTLELDIAFYANSENEEAEEFEAEYVVSGSKGKYTDTVENKSIIFDIDTGYMYVESDDEAGKYEPKQNIPAGLFGYAEDVISAAVGDSGEVDYTEIAKQFSYDKTYGGYIVEVETKDDVNSVLRFAQNAYAEDATLNDVVDSVLQALTQEETFTLEAFLDLMCGDGYDMVKAMPISSLLGENADALFDEIFTALEGMDVELDAETKAAIKNRKVGEILAGVMAVLPDIIESGDFDIEALVTAAFFTEFTSAQIDAVGTMISTYADMLIDFLKGAKVRTYVNQAPADIKAMIATDGFEFSSIAAQVGIKFDGNDISEIMFDGYIEHTFDNGSSEVYEFLGDNNYEAKITIGVTAKDTATSFDIEYSADAEIGSFVMAIVKGYSDKNAFVYFDTCGKTATVSDIVASYMNATTGAADVIAQHGIVFDAANSGFTIPAETLDAVNEACGDTGTLIVTFSYTVGEGTEYGYVMCTVIPDTSIDIFAGVIVGLIESIM